MGDISEEETKIIPGLEIFVLEFKEKLERTRVINERLEKREYVPEILKILFDYELFEKVIKGEFDNYFGNFARFKEECRAYIAMANRLKKEVNSATGSSGIAKKVRDSERYRLMLLESKDVGETFRQVRENDTKEILKSDEITMKTYTALVKARLRIEYSLLNHMQSKKSERRIGRKEFEFRNDDLENAGLEPDD